MGCAAVGRTIYMYCVRENPQGCYTWTKSKTCGSCQLAPPAAKILEFKDKFDLYYTTDKVDYKE